MKYDVSMILGALVWSLCMLYSSPGWLSAWLGRSLVKGCQNRGSLFQEGAAVVRERECVQFLVLLQMMTYPQATHTKQVAVIEPYK